MTDIDRLLVSLIDETYKEQFKNSIWADGKFTSIKNLEIDSRGTLGEKFIADILKALGNKITMNTEKDRTKKHWDILVEDKIKLEIKTATLGKDGRSFQRESIERDRDYDAIVLLDIAPNHIYLTVAPKDTLPFSKPDDRWTIGKRKMHRRATGIHYKWDFSLKDVKDRKLETLEDAKRLFAEVI